jgi:hypothetical protein
MPMSSTMVWRRRCIVLASMSALVACGGSTVCDAGADAAMGRSDAIVVDAPENDATDAFSDASSDVDASDVATSPTDAGAEASVAILDPVLVGSWTNTSTSAALMSTGIASEVVTLGFHADGSLTVTYIETSELAGSMSNGCVETVVGPGGSWSTSSSTGAGTVVMTSPTSSIETIRSCSDPSMNYPATPAGPSPLLDIGGTMPYTVVGNTLTITLRGSTADFTLTS